MGYESKLIIGCRNHFAGRTNKTGKTEIRDYCERIMTIDLSKVGNTDFYNPSNLFNKEIDFDLYMEDGNNRYDVDCYGNKCCYAPIKKVIRFLEKLTKKEEYYRRTDLALKVLKSFKPEDWEWESENGSYGKLVVVHFGY